jgi:5-methylcytosine-specific restriction endonuclease McrA
MGKWRRVHSLPRRWQRNHLIAKYGAVCHLCHRPITLKDLTFDHWVPVSKGGADTLDNYRLAHDHCNQMKANLTPAEFLGFQKGEMSYE